MPLDGSGTDKADKPSRNGRHTAAASAEPAAEYSAAEYLGSARALREADRLDDAEAWLTEAVERFPDNFDIARESARLATDRQSWAEALRRWQLLRKLFPDDPQGYTGAAMIQRQLQWLDEAEATLEQAIERFPAEPEPLIDYARIAEARHDWPEAARRWQAVRHYFPDQQAGYESGALAFQELGQLDEAEALLAEAAERFTTGAAAPTEPVGAWPEAPEPAESDAADPAHPAAESPQLVAEPRPEPAEEPHRGAVVPGAERSLGEYLDAARELRDAGRFDEAEALLCEAVERFPNEARPRAECAGLAHRRRDWAELAQRCEKLRAAFPNEAAGYSLGAAALRELGRPDEAETVLATAIDLFAGNPGIAHESAWAAVHRKDWPEALRRWQLVRDWFPDQPGGHTGMALALRESQRFDEAEALLVSATDLFPDDPVPLIENARVAERRRSWAAAAERWQQLRNRFPDRLEGHTGGALALSSEGRHDEAEQVLDSAMTRFPDVAQIACEHAWVAYRQHRWDDAEQRFARIRRRFPDEPSGYRGGAEVLISRGRLAEAEQLLAEGMERIPTDPHGAFIHALLPASPLLRDRRDWDAALARLEVLCARFADFEHGHIAATRMLREQGRIGEAEAVASRGLQHCVRSAELGMEYARVAQDKADWPEALRRYRMVAERHPDQVTGYIGLAGALAQLDRFDEAEALIQQTMSLFPASPEPFAEFAQLAMRRNEPAEAVRRWSEAASRFPHDAQLAKKLFEARLRAADLDPEASPDAPAEASGAAPSSAESGEALSDMRELVAVFESLGGTLLGCEFGLFQREFGAEPLGLLRWTDIEPDALVAALEAAFDGVGLPENTELLRSSADAFAEYGSRDRRFGMRMHTFVPVREVAEEEMFGQLCRRLEFLKDKLIEDLKSGAKIFVYKITARNLSPDELKRLRLAMRRYGDNTLLYVRYTDDAHPSGTVEWAEPGLMIGYIDRFAMSASGEHLGEATPSWMEICKGAYRLWRAAAG